MEFVSAYTWAARQSSRTRDSSFSAILKKRFGFDDEQVDRVLKIHSVDKVKQEIKDVLPLGIKAHEVLLNRLWIAYNLTEEKTMDKYLKAL